MIEKKYQVFVSSTYVDLLEERQKILNILLMADCIPSGMESFVATDNEQFEVIKKVIDLCDYYILVIGMRYGSINQKTGISYTEMEYEYAKEKGIPVLSFVIDDSVDLPAEKKEEDPGKIEKLQKFKEKAMGNRLCSTWKTSEDLSGKLAISIMRAKSEIIRPGWRRATDFDEASFRREIMSLQDTNKILEVNYQEAKQTIELLTAQNDAVFEDSTIVVQYHYYNDRWSSIQTKNFKYSEIFSIIAVEMLSLSIPEKQIEHVIKLSLLGTLTDGSVSIIDPQLIKKFLIRFQSLGLLDSKWVEKSMTLYWSLTLKGKKLRDEILFNKEAGENLEDNE
jgi:hypothetical protein